MSVERTSRGLLRRLSVAMACLVPLAMLGLALLGTRCFYAYRMWMYTRPYRTLVAQRASEPQVRAEHGSPMEVITTQRGLDNALREWAPLGELPQLREGHVIVYPIDPYGDGEGYVVYLFFDRSGKARRAVVGL